MTSGRRMISAGRFASLRDLLRSGRPVAGQPGFGNEDEERAADGLRAVLVEPPLVGSVRVAACAAAPDRDRGDTLRNRNVGVRRRAADTRLIPEVSRYRRRPL